MANALYDHARRLLLQSTLTWETDNIFCILVAQGTTNTITDPNANLGDIAVSARDYGVSREGGLPLVNATAESNGAADADDVTFQTVSGNTIGSIVLYQNTGSGNDIDHPLILWIDTATGLPINPNGGDIIISWDSGANRIFRP